jgi:2-polyprenyl-3-methyl-5-hydroxy-6-metoxy-1,4-benzoquinol methylase
LLGEFLEELLDNDEDDAYMDAAAVLGNLSVWLARSGRPVGKPDLLTKIVCLVEKYDARDIFPKLAAIKKGTCSTYM